MQDLTGSFHHEYLHNKKHCFVLNFTNSNTLINTHHLFPLFKVTCMTLLRTMTRLISPLTATP